MSSVEEILRKSIEDKCGMGGLMRFNALYAGGFETTDGRPDLPGISTAVGNTFPADQAEAIVATVTKKLEPGGPQEMRRTIVHSETTGTESREALPVFTRYFNADPNHVQDIVSEARRLRAAMGKTLMSEWTLQQEKAIVNIGPVEKAAAEKIQLDRIREIKIAIKAEAKTHETDRPLTEKSPVSPAGPVVARQPSGGVIAEPLSAIDEEIRQFTYGRNACTSIDIIDFIRYLKDKGHSLQECIVLEKIYISIEERKKEARFAIEKEIEGLFDAIQAPGESDICGLLRRLREAGIVFEEEDVRRMVRDAVLRRGIDKRFSYHNAPGGGAIRVMK
jgi:hypothetical protein